MLCALLYWLIERVLLVLALLVLAWLPVQMWLDLVRAWRSETTQVSAEYDTVLRPLGYAAWTTERVKKAHPSGSDAPVVVR